MEKFFNDFLSRDAKKNLNNQRNEALAKMKKKANDTAEIEIIKEELEKSNKMNQKLQGQLKKTSSKYEKMQKALIDEIKGMKENQEKYLDEKRDLARKIDDLNKQYNHFVEEFNEKEQGYIKEIQELKQNENRFEEEKAEFYQEISEIRERS